MIFLLVSLMLGNVKTAKAEETSIPYEDAFEYEEIQDTVDAILNQDSFDFKGYVYDLIKGNKEFSIGEIVGNVLELVKSQVLSDKNLMIRFVGIAIIGAVFTNFSKVFRNSQVSEMGFYVTYLLLFTMICTSFYTLSELAEQTLTQLLQFMKAVIPSYFIAVTFATGVGTSTVFYQGALMLIGVVEALLLHVIFPLIRIYFVIYLVNNLSTEDVLSKFAELLETVINWSLKTLLGVVTGYNVIQGLVVPVADTIKNKTVVRAIQAIPGVGNALGAATETVLGAGVVLKNAVGATGIVVLILIISIPLIRMVFYALLYKLGAAMVQPVSDKRIIQCLSGASKAAGLLVYTTFVGGVLFLMTILIVMATTNGRVS